MPIANTDVVWNYTVATGPGLSVAQANPNDSLGGFASSTAYAGGALHDLFDVIGGTENTNLDTEYRVVFVRNNHGTLAMQNVRIYMSAQVAGGANAAIALDGTGVISSTSATAQAERVANENTAPTGEAFSTTAIDYASGLAPANIPAGSGIAVWIRRTATNSAAINNDGLTIEIAFDTAA